MVAKLVPVLNRFTLYANNKGYNGTINILACILKSKWAFYFTILDLIGALVGFPWCREGNIESVIVVVFCSK